MLARSVGFAMALGLALALPASALPRVPEDPSLLAECEAALVSVVLDGPEVPTVSIGLTLMPWLAPGMPLVLNATGRATAVLQHLFAAEDRLEQGEQPDLAGSLALLVDVTEGSAQDAMAWDPGPLQPCAL